jgi:hypothetical protein
MNWFCRERLSSRLFIFYAALAIAGAFSFTATEALRSIYVDLHPDQDKIFSSPHEYYIQCQAEESTLGAAKGNNSLLRGGLQRFISPWALPNYGDGFPGSSFVTIAQTQFFNVKNTIRLKLRI